MKLTTREYRDAFALPAQPPAPLTHLRVHPGLPAATRLTLWYWTPPGTPEARNVELSLAEVGGSPRAASFRHQPLGSQGRVLIEGLRPGQDFRAVLTLDGLASAPLELRTAPAESSTEPFSFLAYSCFSPFLADGSKVVKARTLHAMRWLERRARADAAASGARPSFALALGDQVYVDEGATHLAGNLRAMLYGSKSQHARYGATTDSNARDFFAALYDAHLDLLPYEHALRCLPHAMMWDDHDIRDGWGSQEDEAKLEEQVDWNEHMNAARGAFLSYQMLRNPAPVQFPAFSSVEGAAWRDLMTQMLAAHTHACERPELHFEFEWGAAVRFFVMDLRSHRRSDRETERVLTRAQLSALERWLGAAPGPRQPRLYVLGGSLPLTEAHGIIWDYVVPQRRDDRRDSWWSKESKADRNAVLGVLVRHFRDNPQDRLLVLSGDVHFAEVLSLALEENGKRIFGHEIVSSGLAQSSYFGKLRRKTQGDAELIGGLHAISAGSRLFVPHFVELFIGSGSATKAPSVDVLFFPAAKGEGKHLVNPPHAASELVGKTQHRLRLDVGDVEPARLESFERFMIEGQDPPEWDDDAPGWDLRGEWH